MQMMVCKQCILQQKKARKSIKYKKRDCRNFGKREILWPAVKDCDIFDITPYLGGVWVILLTMFDLLQWKDTQPGQLMDSKLKCVFELPAHDEPLQQQVTDICCIMYFIILQGF